MGFLTGIKGKSPTTYETRPAPAQPNPAALLQPIWFVDSSASWPGGPWTPTSVQGPTPGSNANASDSNDGLTPGTALLTFAEIIRRWGTNNPTLNQAVTIIFLSDEPGFADPVDIIPILNQFNLTIIGTPTVLLTGGVIGGYTARNYVTGAADTFTDTSGKVVAAQPVLGWFAFGDLIVQTPTATFWVNADETTPGNVVVSAPMQTVAAGSGAFLSPGDGGIFPGGNVPPPLWVTPANGDKFNILQPCKVYVTRASVDLSSAIAFTASGGVGQSPNGIILQNLWIQNPPPAPGVVLPFGELFGELSGELLFMQQCRSDTFFIEELGVFRTSKINCDLTNSVSSNSHFYGGLIAVPAPLSFYFGQTFDGDITIRFFVAQLSPAQILFGTARLGPFCSPIGIGGNGGPGNIYYLSANNSFPESIFYCPQFGGSVNSGQLWGPAVQLALTQGTSFQIANTAGGPTATSSFPSVGGVFAPDPAFITIDGSPGGLGTTQLASYQGGGVWDPVVAPVTPASLDALVAGHVPPTASIQNPDTGTKFCLNGGVQPVS